MEETRRLSRSKRNVEIADIPHSVVEEPVSQQEATPFLRTPRRVPVRRRGRSTFAGRFRLSTRWIRLLVAGLILVALGLVAAVGFGFRSLLLHNHRFLLQSMANIQVSGNRVVTSPETRAIFASDVGQSIFRVPLAKRQTQLEKIPWVRLATVMRVWPNQLRVALVERTPVGFARDGNTVRLVDEEGVLLDLPNAAAQHYSFPVLDGISAADPLSIRAARIQMYRQFVQALDAQGGHVSATLSEVDLSDFEDIRTIFLGGPHQPLVHFGDSNFLPRYQAYQAHLAGWLEQYPQLRSVDMRYGKQVVLDTGTAPADTAASASASKISNATNSTAIQSNGTSVPTGISIPTGTPVPTVSTAKASARTKAAKQPAATRHRDARQHGNAARHREKTHPRHSRQVPERGHTVRHPIMHVVTGM